MFWWQFLFTTRMQLWCTEQKESERKRRMSENETRPTKEKTSKRTNKGKRKSTENLYKVEVCHNCVCFYVSTLLFVWRYFFLSLSLSLSFCSLFSKLERHKLKAFLCFIMHTKNCAIVVWKIYIQQHSKERKTNAAKYWQP